MTTPTPRYRKCARLVRWLSAGRASAWPNIRPAAQTEHISSSLDAVFDLLMYRIAHGQPAGSSNPRPTPSAAAIKSP